MGKTDGGAMSWTPDWTALRFLVDVMMLIGVVGAGAYSWWVARNHATKQAIDNLGDRVSGAEDRLTRVEHDVRSLPTVADVHELNQRIATVHGDLREIKGSLQGLSRAVNLINEHLIMRGGKD